MAIHTEVFVPLRMKGLQGRWETDEKERETFFIVAEESLTKLSESVAVVTDEEDDCVVAVSSGIVD